MCVYRSTYDIRCTAIRDIYEWKRMRDKERGQGAVVGEEGGKYGRPDRGSMGYRSVRVLLQRPRGQRITRNSRLDFTYTLGLGL